MALAAGDAKGKSKANAPEQTSERTPLLQGEASQSTLLSDIVIDAENAGARHRLRSTLTLVFFTSLFLCLLIFAVIVLFAYSFASTLSDVSPQDLLEKGIVFEGPKRVDVLNATDGGIWINVNARVGIDAGSILGVNSEDDEGTLKGAWKSMGRLGVRLIKTVSADLSAVYIYSFTQALLGVVSLEPLELPITANPPSNNSWLTPVSIPLFIQPTNNSSDLAQFVNDSWREGVVSVHAVVPNVDIWGGSVNRNSWRSVLKLSEKDLDVQAMLQLPPIPGLPFPGSGEPFPPFSKLVALRDFYIASSPGGLVLQAHASAVNPAPPTLEMTVPSLPFIVSVPGAGDTLVPLASVHTEPFSLTHPTISILISGHVLPLSPEATGPLSIFVSRYLSLQHNPISIASPLFPSLVIDAEFPSPDTRPDILRNVTIRNMRVKPNSTGNGLLASGEVFARLVLPKGMNFSMDVRRVFPNILVFDGDVPESAANVTITSRNGSCTILPDPLPPRAFGHICPEEWLKAASTYDGSEDGGSAFLVTASIVNVPIQVLPGREQEFSNFVSKVIFSSKGALAGLQGIASIGVHIVSLPFEGGGENSEFVLDGLPLRGVVRIGKKFSL
ncbi:hypothetical protein BKA82DRAFT_4169754 [Pisolithus tinctorius]|nr:hypothetical protein BKA82DRAFT_4169754 [Pisolithus tinctorius]